MSARAIASQKAKRANGTTNEVTSSRFPRNQQNQDAEPLQQTSNTSEPTSKRISLPQAILMLEKRIIEIEERGTSEKTVLTQHRDRINEFGDLSKKLYATITNLETNNATLQKSVTEQNQLEQRISKLENNANPTTSSINEMNITINNLQNDFKSLNAKISKLTSNYDECSKSIKQMEEKISKISDKADTINEIQNLVNTLSAKVLSS